MSESPGEITELLRQAADGSEVARHELFRLIYDDLHAAAHRVLGQRGHAELQTTDLFHESIIRFQDARVLEKYSRNRRVFFAVAIRAMQQVLIDRYRRRGPIIPSSDRLIVDQVISSTESEFGVSFQTLAKALEWLQKESPSTRLWFIVTMVA